MTDPATNQQRALPKYMHVQAGRYYFVKRDPVTKKLRWTALSKDLAVALNQHRQLLDGKPEDAFLDMGTPGHWMSNIAKDLLAQSKKRARQDNIIFSLTVRDIMEIGMASNWRCAVTGVKLRPERVTDNSSMRPFFPSLDRMDTRRGYERGNCRLVCVATNFALNDWGEAVFRELAHSYVDLQQRRRRLENTNGAAKSPAKAKNKSV